MIFKGWQGTTVLDFPGRVASILFTGGCNLRCPYCHNMCIVVDPDSFADLPEEDVLDRVAERANFIDGIVVTGGEPTIHPELPGFLLHFKQRFPDLEVKLDTNGLNPTMLQVLLAEKLLNYVAVDIKTDPVLYPERLETEATPLQETIAILRESGIEWEARSTTWREWMDDSTADAIANLVGPDVPVYLQRCSEEGINRSEAEALCERMKKSGCQAHLRGF